MFNKFSEDRNILMKSLEEKLQFEKKKWRRILKALFVIEHILRVNSPSVIESVSSFSYLIKDLVNFKYEDDSKKDQGGSSKFLINFS